jgi:hypothetical protein
MCGGLTNNTSKMKHKWIKGNKHYKCVKCGCIKYRTSERILMAINNGKNYYAYKQHWEYIPNEKDPTTERPSCIKEIAITAGGAIYGE